jgi:hypothetical protein
MSAALSLKCNVCGVQLRSVAEAQSHGEATGHSDFAESTEAVLNLTCVACGKPCRSETEKDIHSKRTGHTEFVDKTHEQTKTVDTEGEMKAIGDEMKAELGLPIEASSDANKDDAMVVDGCSDEETVEPEVDAALVTELQSMGFSRNKAVRALHFTGTDSVEQAVNWIVEHEKDAEIDDPLTVPLSKARKKTPLSKEEARKKAEELRRSMALKKEKEEKELERLREQERIRSGKELLKAKRAEEELQLKRNLEQRRIEKEEAKRAKAKILAKLEEDRIERRRKLGLPDELTEEEKAKERERVEKKAAEAKAEAEKKAKAGLIVKPVQKVDQLRKLLVDIKKNAADETQSATCFKTLLLYLGNIAKAPEEEKFRVINMNNAAFTKRVDAVKGGRAFLETFGFEPDEAKGTLTLPRDKVDQVLLQMTGAEINGALTNPFFGVL